MKVQLLLMIKDCEDVIENTLMSYRNFVQRYVIVDTGSTDKTLEIVESLDLPISVHRVPFTNFSDTRNKCIEVAHDTSYEWTIFVDDSYELINIDNLDNYKNHDLLNLTIDNGKFSYRSSRIYRTSVGVGYIGDIHEVPDRPATETTKIVLRDVVTEKGLKRTQIREESDILSLKKNLSPRNMFYLSQIYFKKSLKDPLYTEQARQYLYQRIQLNYDPEEMFLCYRYLSVLDRTIYYLFKAAEVFPPRCGEIFLEIYLKTGKVHFLNKAYENRDLRSSRLFVEKDVYGPSGRISKLYHDKRV